MRRTTLQCLAILHHRLDGISLDGAGKSLVGCLDTLDHRQGHVTLGKVGIDIEHLNGFGLRLLTCGVSGVSLLPQELGRAQEQACTHLPAHDVAPLIAQQGQVAIGADPVAIGVPDDGLAGGTNDEFLLKACSRIDNYALAIGVIHQTVVRNHSTLLGKTLNVLGLSAEKRLGNQQGEISILHTGCLEHVVEATLHLLPDGIAIGLDDHAATHCRLLGKVGLHNKFVVPLRIVLSTFC